MSQFFADLSAPGDVENVKEYVTPAFFQYLKNELECSGEYKPVYQIGPIQSWRMCEPYVLLGSPKIFEHVEAYTLRRFPSENSSHPIVKERLFFDPPEPFGYVEVYRKGTSIALASGRPFPEDGPPPAYAWLWAYTLLKHVRPWYKEHLAKGRFKGMPGMAIAAAYMKEVTERTEKPGWEGSLAEIIDFIITVPVKPSLVRRTGENKEEKVWNGKEELMSLVVTLRSNHVTPGWKFNRETVRWYIDDVDLTLRGIPWQEGKPQVVEKQVPSR